jgi:hypothetical protein
MTPISEAASVSPTPMGLVITSVPKVTLRKVSYFKVLSFHFLA